ncbi:MAG: ATP-binding protein [Bacteroidales bacterium]|nr:ATP-binding protein [Bacteroidales bacterium]
MKDLSLHILDIVHNSIRAQASLIIISISENPEADEYLLQIRDNGTGIPPEVLPNVTDPFTTSRKTRKVGMGLALLKQNAEMTGGGIEIKSTFGKGTDVKCWFNLQHIDRPPIGDISGVLLQLIIAFQHVHFAYHHQTNSGEYLFDSVEVSEVLGGLPVSAPEVRKYLREMIDENLNEIRIER